MAGSAISYGTDTSAVCLCLYLHLDCAAAAAAVHFVIYSIQYRRVHTTYEGDRAQSVGHTHPFGDVVDSDSRCACR